MTTPIQKRKAINALKRNLSNICFAQDQIREKEVLDALTRHYELTILLIKTIEQIDVFEARIKP